MKLQTFVFDVGPLEANLFLMAHESKREGVLIDAGVFDESVVNFAAERKLKIPAILITHLHHDHIAGVGAYAKAWGADVVAPAPVKDAPGARIVKEGDRFKAGPFEFEVFKTSGHTPESISYYCASEGVCFVGDAIFAGAVGGTQDDEHHEEEIGHLRRNVLRLPPETELYSGHGPATTVAIELAGNPFLQPGFTRTARG